MILRLAILIALVSISLGIIDMTDELKAIHHLINLQLAKMK